MPSKVWERTNGGFLPRSRPYPFFRRLAPWPFLGSVAGRPKSPSLLIHTEAYHIFGEILEGERTARIGRGQARVRRTCQAGLEGFRTAVREEVETGRRQRR